MSTPAFKPSVPRNPVPRRPCAPELRPARRWAAVPLAALAALALATASAPVQAKAGPAPVDSWICLSGNWSDSACWTGVDLSGHHFPGPPLGQYDAWLSPWPFAPGNAVARYDSTDSAALYTVTVEGTGLGTMTLTQAQGQLNTYNEVVGQAGTASYQLSGGSNHVMSDAYARYGDLQVGLQAGSQGSVALSGSGALNATWEHIGDGGGGSVVQTGGSNTVLQTLTLGHEAGASGSYTLSGATSVLTAGSEVIAAAGNGTFTQNGGTHTVTGSLAIGSGAGRGSLTLAGGTLTVGGDVQIGGGAGGEGSFRVLGGTFVNHAGGTLANAGTLDDEATLLNQGTLADQPGGQILNTGLLRNQAGGVVTLAGSVNNKSGATLDNGGSFTITATGSATNYGTLSNAGQFTLQAGGSVVNSGAFANLGSSVVQGAMTGHGSVAQSAGTLLLAGSVQADTVALGGGAWMGTGTVQATTFTHTGGVLMGGAPGQPGTLRLDGSYSAGPGATFEAWIAGPAAGQAGQVAFSGNVQIAGTLDIVRDPAFSFAAGQQFTLLTAQGGSFGGRFADIAVDGLSGAGDRLAIGNGLVLQLQYDPHDLLLQVAAVPEPAGAALWCAGLGAVLWRVRRRARA